MKTAEGEGRLLRRLSPIAIASIPAVLSAAWLAVYRQLPGLPADYPGFRAEGLYFNLIFISVLFIVVYILISYNNRLLTRKFGEWNYVFSRMWRFIDSAPSMSAYLKDAEGRYQLINRAYEELIGKSRDKILGRTDHEIFPEQYAEDSLHHDLRAVTGKIPVEAEENCPVGDEVHPLYTIKFPLLDNQGTVQGICGIAFDISEIRQTQEELRRSEELLRLTFENAPIGIACADTRGYFFTVNPFWCQLFGYTQEELKNRTLIDITDPQDRETITELQRLLMDGDLPQYELEQHFIRKDGTAITGLTRVGLVRDQDGEPLMQVCQTEDITEKKAAVEKLRKREELLRLTFENAPTAIGIANLDGKFVEVNQAFCKLLGYDKEEIINHRVQEYTYPDDWGATAENLDKVRSGEIGSYAIKKRYVRKDGSIITGIAQVGVVHDADDKPIMVIGQIQDITEQEKALEERQQLRQYLKNIIDSMPSILVGVDTDGRVTAWNATAFRMTGIATEDAAGKPLAEVLPVLESQLEQVKKAIDRGVSVTTERIAMESLGDLEYADVVVYPLMANGAMGAVIRVDDITSRVRIEEMMVQTEKMLSIGGLAAGMAHEINNPLGAILQGVQNVSRRLSPNLDKNRMVASECGVDMDDMQRYLESRSITDFLDRIQEAGIRASKIVSDMLTFSRRSELHLEPTDPRELLDTAVRLAASDYDLKKKYDFKLVQINRDFDPELSQIHCDKTEIEQVILNLLRNAAQAMATNLPAGRTPTITLRTRREEDYAVIEVEDNGPGMSEETRRHIFEPFFTTKEVGIGTGLGLSVSYFIVTDQHRGTLSVKSSPGAGACFRIRLPLKREK